MPILKVPVGRPIYLIKQYKVTYKNWIHVLWSLYTEKNNLIYVKLTNSQSLYLSPNDIIRIKGIKVFNLSDELITFDFLGRKIVLKDWKLGYPGDCFYDYHLRLNPNGKKILDIGAAIGDSPIFFSIMGAKEVTAVEMNEKSIEAMEYNLKQNNVNNVRIIKAKVIGEGPASENEITLDDLIKRYGPFDLAKIDCDGCEHDIIPKSKSILSIPEIFVEYENTYQDLKTYLSNTHEIKIEETLKHRLGYLYAKKNHL